MPAPCDTNVFEKGHSAIVLDGCSFRVEEWVQSVAKASGQLVDWHYSGGRANVLYVGDFEAVAAAIDELLPRLEDAVKKTAGHSCRCVGDLHDPMVVLERPTKAGEYGLYRAR